MNTLFKHKKIISLTLLMIIITGCVTAITIYILHNRAQEDVYNRLTDIVQREKSIVNNLNKEGLSEKKIIKILRYNAHIGKYGEVVYGKENDKTLEYFINSKTPNKSFILSKTSSIGAPMRGALTKKDGILRGSDYNGTEVYAAYTYITELKWGISAQIPTKEINQPYINAIILIIVSTLILIAVFTYLLIRITNPVIEQLIENEKKLIKANKDTENYLNIVEVILVAFDKNANIILLNRKGHEVLGYEEGELYNKNWYEVCLKENERESVYNIYLKIIAGEIEPYEYNENYIVTRKGEEKLIAWHNKLIKDENGVITGVLSSGEDITQKRQDEIALKKLNAELEERVSIRTKELEESNKELLTFTYSISHDLRAPLRHINGYIELIQTNFPNEIPEKGKHYLSIIFDSANVMAKLIDDLLQFARNNRRELKKTTFELSSLLEEIMMNMKDEIGSREIEWNIESLPMIKADFELTKIIWINLLSNAIKYTKKKEKAFIEIGYKKENNSFVFYVKDNGVGFDMHYAQKLFGVFQRMHTNEEFEGTGTGLASVKRIVQRHGGNIWAEAEVNKGACFYFSLPTN